MKTNTRIKKLIIHQAAKLSEKSIQRLEKITAKSKLKFDEKCLWLEKQDDRRDHVAKKRLEYIEKKRQRTLSECQKMIVATEIKCQEKLKRAENILLEAIRKNNNIQRESKKISHGIDKLLTASRTISPNVNQADFEGSESKNLLKMVERMIQ